MPLRDHFHPPTSNIASWEGFHAQWPAMIVLQLFNRLPAGYVSEPRVHLGSRIEIDIATFKQDNAPEWLHSMNDGDGDVATAVYAPPLPTLEVEISLPDYDEYEVRIYDVQRGRQLVAAIEIVSPANKDRPESRNAFVAKCAALLQKGVAVSIVDLVTSRHFNLYRELIAFVGLSTESVATLPDLYAASARWVAQGERTVLQSWAFPMTIGAALPTLPIWLGRNLAITLPLESIYEPTCTALHIP